MIKEMRFEKMEKAKLYFWYGLSVVLGVLFCAGYYWTMTSVEVVTKLEVAIVCLLTFCSVATVVIGAAIIMIAAKKKMEENLETFRFNAKVDEFLECLGNGGMQVEPKISLPNASAYFKSEFVKKRNCTYYVRRKRPDVLYIWRNNKNGEKNGAQNVRIMNSFLNTLSLFMNLKNKKHRVRSVMFFIEKKQRDCLECKMVPCFFVYIIK